MGQVGELHRAGQVVFPDGRHVLHVGHRLVVGEKLQGREHLVVDAGGAQVVEGHGGVLDHVVQPGYGLGLVALDGDRHVRRVADVGLAGLVDLASVGPLRCV